MVELRKEAIAQVMITQGSSLQAVWLTVAMAVAAKREPVMVTEGVASGWETVDGTGQTRGGREDRDLPVSLVVKNGSKMWSFTSSSMPVPVSLTCRTQ